MPDANRMPVPMESHQADFPHSLLDICTLRGNDSGGDMSAAE